jgi:hypothetical protein
MAVSNLSLVNHELDILVPRIVALEYRFHELYDEFACWTGVSAIISHLERIWCYDSTSGWEIYDANLLSLQQNRSLLEEATRSENVCVDHQSEAPIIVPEFHLQGLMPKLQ